MRAVLAFLILAVAACASTVDTAPTGTTSGSGGGSSSTSSGMGGAGAGPTTCPSTGDAGGPPTMCVATWECAAPTNPPFTAVCSEFAPASYNGGPLPPDLPLAQPFDGTCCTIEGLACGGYTDCGPICRCKGGVFKCSSQPTCTDFVCPTDGTSIGALESLPCDHIGMFCSTMGCGPQCGCMLDPATGNPSWHCITPPC